MNESFLLQVMMDDGVHVDRYVNSSYRCAHQLGTLLANCNALVMLNIIPYNPAAPLAENLEPKWRKDIWEFRPWKNMGMSKTIWKYTGDV